MSATLPNISFTNPELVRINRAQRRLIRFTQYTCPDYDAGWFHTELADELDVFLDKVVRRESPRLMAFAPPRSGKTELVSRRLPAYVFGRYPDLTIIATSYSGDLASTNNRDVQRILDDASYAELFPETRLFGANVRTVARGTWIRNNDAFEIVNHRGAYRSAGVMGSITGKGAHILIVDDPIKDALEAESETYRKRLWEWWTSTAYTRLAPGAGVLIIQTRWHEDDLSGRIIEHAKLDGAEKWKVISYPALAEKDEPHRKKDEALHPSRYDETALNRIRNAVGERVWISLFQQRPTAAEGAIFKRGHEQYIYPGDIEKKQVQQRVLSLDAAVKEKETSDFSVLLEGWQFDCGESKPKGILVRSRIHGRMAYPQLRELTKEKSKLIAASAVLVEDKSAGQQIIQELQQTTSLPIVPVQVSTDKVTRAWVTVPTWEANRIYFPCDKDGVPEPWVLEFLTELFSFPNAAHDDQVDALTQMISYFTLSGGGIIEFYQTELAKADVARKARIAEDRKHHNVEYINLLGATRR